MKIIDKVSNCFEKINIEIRQSLQEYERTTKKKLNLNLSASCDLLLSCLEGQIQSFVRSKFKKDLSGSWEDQWNFLKKLSSLIKKKLKLNSFIFGFASSPVSKFIFLAIKPEGFLNFPLELYR